MPKSILLGQTRAIDEALNALIDARGLTNVEVARPIGEEPYNSEAYEADGIEQRLRGLVVRGLDDSRPAIVIVCCDGGDAGAAFQAIHNQICATDNFVAPPVPNRLSSGECMYPPVAIMPVNCPEDLRTHLFEEIVQFLRELPTQRVRTNIVEQ